MASSNHPDYRRRGSQHSRSSNVCDAFSQLTGGQRLSKVDAGHQFRPSLVSKSSAYSAASMYSSHPSNTTAIPTTRRSTQRSDEVNDCEQQRYSMNHDPSHQRSSHCSRVNPYQDVYQGPHGYTPSHNPSIRRSASTSVQPSANPRERYSSTRFEECVHRTGPVSSRRSSRSVAVSQKSMATRVTRNRDGNLELQRSASHKGESRDVSRADRFAMGFVKYVVGNY